MSSHFYVDREGRPHFTAEGNGIPHILAQLVGPDILRGAHEHGDDIADDVAMHHVEHMTECSECTWWYCDHYPCDCHEPCIGRHDAEGRPLHGD